MDMNEDHHDLATVGEDVPLDKRTVEVTNKDGKKVQVPALNKGFAKNRIFVLYELPPLTDSKSEPALLLATQHEHWMESVSFFRDDLKFLLSLPHHRFWSQVVFHLGLHTSLESFLSQAFRPHDMSVLSLNSQNEDPRQTEVAKIISELHQLVFLVYHRMSSCKESKSCYITPTAFGKFLYRYFLYDIPKIMDLCAIYWQDNKPTLQKMINNVFTHSPMYYDDLGFTVPVIIQAFENVEVRLFLRPPTNSSSESVTLKSRQGEKNITDIKWSDLLDVIMYVLDMAVTVHNFLDILPSGCKAFHLQGFTIRVATFYELVIPSFVKEVHRRSYQPEVFPVIDEVKKRISLARSCLLKIFRQVLYVTCIQPIVDEGSAEGYQCIDELLHVMTSILPERSFVADYEPRWAFSDDVVLIKQTGISVDPNRFDYILEGLNTIVQEKETGFATQILNMTKNIPSKSNKHRNKASIDHMTSSTESADVPNNAGGQFNYGDEGASCAGVSLSGVELDSCISQVKDLLPELGDGFVETCLRYYNYNCESVINALLESNLPPQLEKLDRNQAKRIQPIVEPALTMLSERRNEFDGDEFDVFQRSDIDKSRVHRGKWRNSEALKSSMATVSEDIKKLTLGLSDKLESEGRSRRPVNLMDPYDDEYDDTYDEQMVGDTGSSTLDELLDRRPFSVPRILASRDAESEEDEEENTVNHNWREDRNGERGPPRDEFITDPAVLRERAAQRWIDKRGGGAPFNNRNVRGRPRGQGQEENVVRSRSTKEKNKSSSANHSRRFMGDRKRSGGMYPT